jgi:hypothetical protein
MKEICILPPKSSTNGSPVLSANKYHFSWLDFQREDGQTKNSNILSFIPLPFGYFNKPSGYTCYHDGNLRHYQRVELDLLENKCLIMEEIERLPFYPFCDLLNKSYVTFSNGHEEVVCNFIPTYDKSRLKVNPVFRQNEREALRIEAFFDHFLITHEPQDDYWPCFVRCTRTQRRVEIIQPDSLRGFDYVDAVNVILRLNFNIV